MRGLAVLALAAALTVVPSTAADDETGSQEWVSLFDGRTKAGWTMTGPGRFTVERGALVTHGGMGLLWFDRRRFGDFELEVDWKVSRRCDNSGVFVRFPAKPRTPADAVSSGYEVQIDDCDPRGLSHRTGSIYDHAPAVRPASLPVGRWNRFRIRVVGQRIRAFLNDARMTTFDGMRARAGYIGLQNHDSSSRVSFRRIRVRPLN